MPNLRMFVLMLLLALIAVSCGSNGSDTASSSSVSSDPPTTTAPEPTSTAPPDPAVATEPEPTTSVQPSTTATIPPAVEEVVNVYWGGTVVNSTGTPERLLAGGRSIASTSLTHSAIEALLAGPTELETEIGMFTSIPAGTTLLDLSIADRVANIDLSLEFEQSSGSLDEFIRIGQIVFTLTQFESVDAVTFSIDGEDRDELASHGIDVSSPVDRDDFEAIRAFILPERPYPGSLFQSGDTIAGESNTFEANVQWVIADSEGLIIGEGFTTATDGNGTWGRFEVSALLDAESAGRGSIIIFDTSARDGSQINIVEFPIELEGA